MNKLYNMTLNNVAFYDDKDGNKISQTTVSIPLDLLKADEKYQRISTSSEKKIAKLAENWDDTLCDPIRVVAHPEEGAFYLIDGWHRFNAAKLIEGKEFLEAKIIVFHSDNYSERQKYEASLFLRQGDNREILRPAQMHNGRLLIGDNVAMTLENVCKEYGIEIVSNNAKYGTKKLCNYSKGYNVVKRGGEKCLRYILDVIHYSGFEFEPNGYSGFMFETFKSFYIGYGDKVSAKQIGSFLRNMSIATFKAAAINKYPHMSKTQDVKAMIMYLQDYVMETLSLPAVYDANGNKVISITEKSA